MGHRPTSWHCQRCGDCCRYPWAVALTHEELALLRAAAPEVPIHYNVRQDGFVALHTAPCPYHVPPQTCLVYPVRPYNCRRYGCYRQDAHHEPWNPEPIPACVLKNRELRRQYARNQHEAQTWALAHGWRAEE